MSLVWSVMRILPCDAAAHRLFDEFAAITRIVAGSVAVAKQAAPYSLAELPNSATLHRARRRVQDAHRRRIASSSSDQRLNASRSMPKPVGAQAPRIEILAESPSFCRDRDHKSILWMQPVGRQALHSGTAVAQVDQTFHARSSQNVREILWLHSIHKSAAWVAAEMKSPAMKDSV